MPCLTKRATRYLRTDRPVCFGTAFLKLKMYSHWKNNLYILLELSTNKNNNR